MIKLSTKTNNVWFTSDWHYNHKNLCKGTSSWNPKNGCRDFDNLEDMWKIIRDNVNRLVQPQDVLVNLGDLIFGDKTKFPQILDEINCKNLIYVMGNHDDWMYRDPKTIKHFKYWCDNYVELAIDGQIICCSHYAFRTWREQGKKSIQLFGHSHASLPDNPDLLSIDVGVDTCLFGHEKYTPYSFAEIMNIMKNHKNYKVVDHHNEATT